MGVYNLTYNGYYSQVKDACQSESCMEIKYDDNVGNLVAYHKIIGAYIQFANLNGNQLLIYVGLDWASGADLETPRHLIVEGRAGYSGNGQIVVNNDCFAIGGYDSTAYTDCMILYKDDGKIIALAYTGSNTSYSNYSYNVSTGVRISALRFTPSASPYPTVNGNYISVDTYYHDSSMAFFVKATKVRSLFKASNVAFPIEGVGTTLILNRSYEISTSVNMPLIFEGMYY